MRTIRKLEIRERRVRLEAHEKSAPYGRTIRSPGNVVEVAKALLRDEAQEVFLVFLLDIRNRIVGYVEAHRGGVDICPVDPRVVFRAAVVAGASGIIVAHNHPSGDPSPSAEDGAITARLRKVGELLEVKLLDHVIIGGGRHFSYIEVAGALP